MQASYRETWAEICFILSENINSGIAENVYEQKVIMALEKLGWSQFKKEIQTQKSLTIGRQSTIRPDIVLYGSSKRALVAIEVKRPAEKRASLEQLKSYMRQMKADFGLLVGHEIRIYYDGVENPNPEPLQLGKVLFDPDSTVGQQFVEIFTKANFLKEEYKPFLNKKISQFNLKREVDKLKKDICGPEMKAKVLSYLKSEYAEISQDIVSEAFRGLKIDIYYQDTQTPHKSLTKPIKVKSSKRLFSNQEIQSRISRAAQHLNSNEIEKLCSQLHSKEIFNINFPLFIKIPKNITEESKLKALKDSKGVNRWTLKYVFEKNEFLYAITTQWYEKSDIHVKEWLSKNE